MFDEILLFLVAISGLLVTMAVFCELFLRLSVRETIQYGKRLKVKRRDCDDQLVALIIPARRVSKQKRMFGKIKYTYQVCYDGHKWDDISKEEYDYLACIDMIGEEYWRPISEEEGEELLKEINAINNGRDVNF